MNFKVCESESVEGYRVIERLDRVVVKKDEEKEAAKRRIGIENPISLPSLLLPINFPSPQAFTQTDPPHSPPLSPFLPVSPAVLSYSYTSL